MNLKYKQTVFTFVLILPLFGRKIFFFGTKDNDDSFEIDIGNKVDNIDELKNKSIR